MSAYSGSSGGSSSRYSGPPGYYHGMGQSNCQVHGDPGYNMTQPRMHQPVMQQPMMQQPMMQQPMMQQPMMMSQPQQQQNSTSTNNTVVVTQPSQPSIIMMNGQKESRPSSYMALAVFVTICCNLPCGLIAICFSVMSSCAADDSKMGSARTRGRISCGLSVTGILITVLTAIMLIVYFTVIVHATVSSAVSSIMG